MAGAEGRASDRLGGGVGLRDRGRVNLPVVQPGTPIPCGVTQDLARGACKGLVWHAPPNGARMICDAAGSPAREFLALGAFLLDSISISGE